MKRLVLVVMICASATSVAEAQRTLRMTGQVVDSAGTPVAGAQVEVLGTYWATVSQKDGSFGLSLPTGRWQLLVRRLGFRPAVIPLAGADSGSPAFIVVRLTSAPLSLANIVVQAQGATPFRQTVSSEAVRQLPALVEPDLFRATVLLPAVSQPNDLKGKVHLAGGSSDETGVRLDGHPVQDPFHVLGILGSFNADALEAAHVSIHHLPPSVDGRLSGVIDLETRDRTARASTDVAISVIAASAAATRSNLPGDVDLLVAARVTYLDKLLKRVFTGSSAAADLPLPGFYDALIRVGGPRRNTWRWEALGFATRDERTPSDGSEDSPSTAWGESLVGFRLMRDGSAWDVAARGSASLADARRNTESPDTYGWFDISRQWASTAIEATRTSQYWRSAFGLSLDVRRIEQVWDNTARTDLLSGGIPAQFSGEDDLVETAIFAESSYEVGPRWTLSVGGRQAWVNGRAYLAPRLAVSFRPRSSLRLEAAADRRYQFDAQVEEPITGSITSPVFLLDAPRRADVLGLAAAWHPTRLPLGRAGSLQLQVFSKRYHQHTVARSLALGIEVDSARFPDFLRTTAGSTGASLAAQWQPTDASLIQFSYTAQKTWEDVAGERTPTSFDTPHELSLATTLRMKERWTFNLAFQARSGAVSTPVEARILVPALEGNGARARYIPGARNSFRAPTYLRLDVGVARAWRFWGAEWTLSANVLNVTFRENPVEYDWRGVFCAAQGVCPSRSAVEQSGLPIVPSIGLTAHW
ncbi:MAG: TonB-dependent receptor [Gemmatimonadaceae bacterium]